jgi:ATP-binding cassette, subfamily A (ABC1), member 3
MDEADILGDRIAIMADGELKTVGSSFFLKKRFGTGYRLICEKKNGCRAQKLEEVLKNFADDVKLESDSQTEVTFILSEENQYIFHDIFKFLEDNSEKLKISSFGCSLTTMEEVFLKIGSDSLNDQKKEVKASNGATIHEQDEENDVSVIDFDNCVQYEKVKGLKLIMYQCEATILKKFFYLRRNYSPIIYYLLLIILLIYLFLATPIEDFYSTQSLDISLEKYQETTTILELEGESSR